MRVVGVVRLSEVLASNDAFMKVAAAKSAAATIMEVRLAIGSSFRVP